MIKKYDFYKLKYGDELLIDLIRLESLEKYILGKCPHVLSYFDITFIIRGDGLFKLDHRQYSLCPGMVIFSSPGQVRLWEIEHSPEGFALIFEEEFLSTFLNDKVFMDKLLFFNQPCTKPVLFLNKTESRELTNLMLGTEKEVHSFKQQDKHILKALLYQTLIWLNRRYKAVNPNVSQEILNRHIEGFQRLIRQYYLEQHKVVYYADKLNITPGHLNDLCKKHVGTSAKNMVQQKLLTEAKNLLLYTNLSISEIVDQLHFEDASYFSRWFCIKTGTTPLSYRKGKNP